MNLFDNMLKSEESLFLDLIALDFDYLPKLLPHRENQQHYIADCIKSLFNNRAGKNLFITGKPGVGKTAAVKFVLRELEEKSLDEEVYPIYINCWKKDTPHKIAIEICNQINYKFTHNKNTDELFEKIKSIINKKAAVFVLDEVDKVQDMQILYSLLEDIYKKTILLITNNESWIVTLDSRIRSRLMPELLEFKPYNYEETKNIMKQRRDYAFVKDVFENDAFMLIVEKTFKLEDIRSGLFLLKESGEIAESKSYKKILKENVIEAIKNLDSAQIKNSSDLDEEKDLLELIKKNPNKQTKELYGIYKEKIREVSYRTFQRKIKKLEENNFIKLKELKGIHGKSFIVELGSF